VAGVFLDGFQACFVGGIFIVICYHDNHFRALGLLQVSEILERIRTQLREET